MKKYLISFSILLVVFLSGCETEINPSDDNDDNGNQIETVTYDITWMDENGTLIEVTEVDENSIVYHTYDVTDTDEWDYTFEGWSTTQDGSVLSSLPNATEDATYYAIVSSVKQQYRIMFETNGGSWVDDLVVDYGTSITELPEVTKDGYNFIAWNTDVDLTSPVILPIVITENITLFASWNESIPFGSYLQMLLDSYSQNPYSELPESMLANNYINNSVISDYSSFIDISSINYNVFGEQWEMVLANMDQTSKFSDLLSIVEILSSTSLVAYNNYLDSNPANTEYYQFDEGIYTITIEVSGDVISYSVTYTGTVPAFGEQTISLELTYNFVDESKTGRIQVGTNNVLQYEVTEDSYIFAISYLGIRDAYFEMIVHEDGSVEGAIFEYLTFDDYSLESAAQFLIDDSNVYVIGNKASSIPGFTGTIVEVYDVTTGQLIGYEVQETLSLITFNTLWFRLDNQTGITNIKVLDITNDLNMNSVYVNDSVDLFESQEVGGLLNPKQTSRRYDIELRTVYYYELVGEDLVKVQLEVPMLFVQEEVLDDLESDIVSNNASITSFTLDIPESDITLIQDAYTTYIPIFLTNKDNISYEDILNYLGLNIE